MLSSPHRRTEVGRPPARWLWSRWCIGLLSLISVACWDGPTQADPQAPGEYVLKAAFLYNFAKFVEWPEGAFTDKGPFTICVLGPDPFGSALDSIEGKSVKNRALVVKHLETIAPAKSCQIVFVSASELAEAGRLSAAVKGLPVLTVCDAGDCAERGLMVNLRKQDDKVRFDINLDVLQHTSLRVSSQLMKLATIVRGN